MTDPIAPRTPLDALRDGVPEANEREAYLFEALLGAMSLLVNGKHGTWMNTQTWRPREEEIGEWIKATYGFDVIWRKPESKGKRRR